MRNNKTPIDVIIEEDPLSDNEARRLAAFEMLFKDIAILPLADLSEEPVEEAGKLTEV